MNSLVVCHLALENRRSDVIPFPFCPRGLWCQTYRYRLKNNHSNNNYIDHFYIDYYIVIIAINTILITVIHNSNHSSDNNINIWLLVEFQPL